MIYHGAYPTHPRIENQALYLISQGLEVHLFCVTYDKIEARNEHYKGIHIHRYYLPSWMYQLSALAHTLPLYHLLMKPRLDKYIKASQVHVLHLHNMYLAQPIFELNASLQLPVVLDLHENVPEIMKHYPHLQSWLGKLLINPKTWKSKEEVFVQQANKVIVVTNDAKSDIEQRTGIAAHKTLVLPNFTDPSFHKESFDQGISKRFAGKFNVLYIGDTGQRRGLESVIRSIPLLVEDIPNFNLIIVGSSNNDPALWQLIEREKVLAHVSIEGWQSEHTLPDYVHVAHVGICPILRNIHHDTTYANKLFQYAMLGKAVLASDCTAQKNLIEKENWGLTHRANDSEDFAQQMKVLHSNEKLLHQFGQNAKKSIAEKYNFEHSNFGRAFYQDLSTR